MKNFDLIVLISICLMVSVSSLADQSAQVLEYDSINLLTHRTWEGTFTYSEEQIIRIENQKDLHVLVYKCEGHEGMLIDFAVLDKENSLKMLMRADTNIKGVTPILESIDVLVGEQGSEIIVRWKTPGQGGLRSISKYYYDSSEVMFIDKSYLAFKARGNEWISKKSSELSTPATRIEQNPKPIEPR